MPLSEANWFWNAGQVEALTEMQVEALGLHSGIVFSPSEARLSLFLHAQSGDCATRVLRRLSRNPGGAG